VIMVIGGSDGAFSFVLKSVPNSTTSDGIIHAAITS
jgi:hypothetical protein